MLGTADAQLARRDADIPGLELALDTTQLAEALSTLMPQATISDVACHYLRYKPGTSCLAALRAQLNDRPCDMALHAFHRDARKKILKTVRPNTRTSKDFAALAPAMVPRRATVVWSFPHDRHLPGLARLFDKDSSHRFLQNLLCAHGSVIPAQIRTIRYKPYRRFVGQMCLANGNAVLLKCYDRRGYAAAQRNAKVFSSRGPLQIADRLGRSNRHRVVATQWLTGELLADRLTERASDPPLDLVANVGTALGELHVQNATGLRCETLEECVLAVRQMAEFLGYLLPGHQRNFHRLAQRIAGAIIEMPRIYQSTHGDFYAQQVLAQGRSVGILDLDRGVLSDPATDLANFIAHLEYDVLRGVHCRTDVERIVEALLAGYCLTADRSIMHRINAHTSAALFRLASLPFRARQQGWPHLAERLAQRAGDYLRGPLFSESQSGAPIVNVASPRVFQRRQIPLIVDPFGVHKDARMPFLALAIDPANMTARFNKHLRRLKAELGVITIQSIRVIRYKPARRCLLEYHLECSPGHASVILLGKVQAKRLKPERFALFRSIHNAGFAEEAGNDVAVPEPLAIFPEIHMWVQRKVRGCLATNFLTQPAAKKLVLRIADALAKLHEAGVPAPAPHTEENELALLDNRLSVVSRHFPHWSSRIDRLLNKLHASRRSLDAYVPRGIHRDFYSDQVIVNGKRLYLIDFDLYASGDPALDAGNFVGHLIEFGLRHSGDYGMLGELQGLFIARFLDQTRETTRRNVELYTTYTLARHIYLSTRFPKRKHLTQRLLELCERRAPKVRPVG